MFKKSFVAAAVSATLVSLAPQASELAEDQYVEQITIFGSQEAVDATPGSGVYIDQETLENYAITDIMRVLQSAPGVYVTEEDGYGLRPNIGMRGNTADRSEKVTITEDGVLAAPAPYASPAAYYFPTIGRMDSIEVLKGSSSVMYGPRASGGVINLTSTAIPKSAFAGEVDAAVGSDGFRKLHANVGGSGDRVGGIAEVFHYAADGFKQLNSGQDTGFNKTDVMTKIDAYLDEDKRHHLEVKLKYSEETSDETYAGLTYADFTQQPYSRYSASQNDVMNAEHEHASLHYDFYISDDLDLSVIAYRNNFHRNWYKVSKIGGLSLGSGAEELASEFDRQVSAGQSPDPLSVVLKANNRDYVSQGIQAQFGYRMDAHNINIGVRVHDDYMDRFQWKDEYALNADLSLSSEAAGTPGTDSNRIDSANAIALFVHDTVSLGDLTLSGGLRYENVNLARDDWGTSDPLRDQAPAERRNGVSELMPSIGATYQLNDEWLVLAGVQKAFAPPSPGNNNAAEEEGWNYEFGTRFNTEFIKGEVIGFVTALDNLHGNCTASQGCAEDQIGRQFNAGKVDVKGLEIVLSHAIKLDSVSVPFNLNYTYTEATFEESFDSAIDLWGSVTAGDELPYLPQQVMQIETGIEAEQWHLLMAVKYMGDMRVTAGSGAISAEQDVESRTIVDLSAQYQLSDNASLYAVVDNLLDKEYIATRQHGGVQVGKPRSIQVGYRYQF